MIFNSIEFLIFLILVFLLYWFVFNKSAKQQNILLLSASLFFYGWADWRFLFLISINTIINYYLGLKIAESKKDNIKKQLLLVAVVFNIGVLGYYKYFNFFIDSFIDILNLFGSNLHYSSLRILLPLGISFYTFQTLGYILDIYREESEPENNFLNFSTYVTFFPKLLAGPIERARNFLPQIDIKRDFNYLLAIDGLKQILWGLFAKIVISGNCSLYTSYIFNNYDNANGSTILIGAFLYSFEIYADFSGYSNIAIGVSKLLGIKLMTNFSTPFFSTNISDFWKKWHISLTSWMMDYVNTPLSFKLRNMNKLGLLISIICTFLLVGLWHGAEWKYLLYGLLQGLYFVPLLLFKTSKRTTVVAKGKLLPSLFDLLKMAGLFILISLTFVFVRANNIFDAINYLKSIFTNNLLAIPDFPVMRLTLVSLMLVLILYLFIEWLGREQQHAIAILACQWYKPLRWIMYYVIILACIYFTIAGTQQQFIYFQF